MSDRKFGLYKRIMKRDPKVIDEIENLEEAKEIISMIMGNQCLNATGLHIDEKLMEEFKSYIDNNPQIFVNNFVGDESANLHKYNDDIMKAIRQNMGLEENDESADNEIVQMDEKEVFKAYCHWNGFRGNWYEILLKTVENIYGVELE